MKTEKVNNGMDMKAKLSLLWIFVMFNYIYCDVLSNMGSDVIKGFIAGQVGSIHITEGFILGAAVLMEIPIVMILLSRFLNYRANRWANMIAGVIMILAQAGSFFAGGTPPTLHYIFYSIIEIGCDALIVWLAFRWTRLETK